MDECDEPVHIVKEDALFRDTHAFIEFKTMEDAANAVFKWRSNGPRRLGGDDVEVSMSSTGEMMAHIFYRVKGVDWVGYSPIVRPDDSAQPWERFKGLLQQEDLTIVVKQIERPNRVSNGIIPSLACQNRLFPVC